VNNRKTKPGATPGASCAFSFTNRVSPGDRQRYFQLRTP
jgi:hypothetical protein